MNDNKQRIWRLISRRMAGEASPAELLELQNLLQSNPEIQYFMETLRELWKPAEQQDDRELESLYEKHMLRMRRMRPSGIGSTGSDYSRAVMNNYFKVIVRNLSRYKGFSFINIAGLAIGMASAILILLWIQNEWSFDKFHKNKDRLYVMYTNVKVNGKIESWSGAPTVLTPVLQTSYPQVEDVTRLNGVGGIVLHVGDRHFEANGMMADPGFLRMFSFPLVKGTLQQALTSPRSMVITEKFAKQIFPDREALGQVIRIDSNAYFKVDGVLKDLPNNTDFNFEYLIPYSYIKEVHWYKPSWTEDNTLTFALLKPGVTVQAANNLLRNVIKEHAPNSTSEVFLHPLTKWRLYSNFENGKPAGGFIKTVRLYGIIAAFILLIACINYMNLSTARSIRRAKEVGIRKVVGAGRLQSFSGSWVNPL